MVNQRLLVSANTEFLCDVLFHDCKHSFPWDITTSWGHIDINCNSVQFTVCKLLISKYRSCRWHRCPADTNWVNNNLALIPHHARCRLTAAGPIQGAYLQLLSPNQSYIPPLLGPYIHMTLFGGIILMTLASSQISWSLTAQQLFKMPDL